ncbi:MAG: DUF4332 domain-containing protein [Bacteroidales bacterium]|nr:DUF4332 domain-containing protein [Bacteroidales bacterium]
MKRYSIDPGLITLDHFKRLTGSRRMLPGRVALQEQMDERFGLLKRSGIENLRDLLRILDSKSKIESYAIQTALPPDYLVLLKREAGSYLARPFPLSNFPGIPYEYVELLKSKGIKNTKDLFEQVQSEHQQAQLAASTGIPEYRLMELFSLCDLSRITGVGGLFARVVYEAGIRSTGEFARTEAASQVEKYLAVIEKHGYAAGTLGVEDIRYSINYASVIVACDIKSDR